jgi:hypothetical protein
MNDNETTSTHVAAGVEHTLLLPGFAPDAVRLPVIDYTLEFRPSAVRARLLLLLSDEHSGRGGRFGACGFEVSVAVAVAVAVVVGVTVVVI